MRWVLLLGRACRLGEEMGSWVLLAGSLLEGALFGLEVEGGFSRAVKRGDEGQCQCWVVIGID